MRIGLLTDAHNFPNLCAMKLSAWHKSQGDYAELWGAEESYDRVYISKVFTESAIPEVTNAAEIIYGGSGYTLSPLDTLPDAIEHSTPDYTLYPQHDFALGMLTRGCPRCNHTFCITPKKDGCISRKVADLTEFWTGQKDIVLLDQNMLACREHRLDLLTQLCDSGAQVEFNGGLDVRFVDDAVIDRLRHMRVKDYHFAWDDPREELMPNFRRIVDSGIKNPNAIGVYVLTNYWSTHEEDLRRIYELRSLGLMPFVMIYDKQKYVDSRGRWLPCVADRYTPEELRHFKICQHMQRWCGNRALLKSCMRFEDYEPYARMVDDA